MTVMFFSVPVGLIVAGVVVFLLIVSTSFLSSTVATVSTVAFSSVAGVVFFFPLAIFSSLSVGLAYPTIKYNIN